MELLAEWGLEFRKAAVDFTLPGGLEFEGGDYVLSTTAPTRVSIEVDRDALRLRLSPGLVVDLTWPVSDVRWSGLVFDSRRAVVSDVRVKDTQGLAFTAEERAASAIGRWFTERIRNTRLAFPGYFLMSDPYLPGFVRSLQGALGGGAVPAGALEVAARPRLRLVVSPRRALRFASDGHAVEAAVGARLKLGLALAGSLADVSRGDLRPRSLEVRAEGLFVTQGERQDFRLEDLRVDLEGDPRVQLLRYRMVGGPARMGAGIEVVFRALGAVLEPRYRSPLGAPVVHEATRRVLEERLTAAWRRLDPLAWALEALNARP